MGTCGVMLSRDWFVGSWWIGKKVNGRRKSKKERRVMPTDVEVVEIRKAMGDGNLKALADLKINGNLLIRGFSVMQGRRGVFVGMPRKTGRDGKWFDILTPSDELKIRFEEKVLEAYDRETDGVKN